MGQSRPGSLGPTGSRGRATRPNAVPAPWVHQMLQFPFSLAFLTGARLLSSPRGSAAPGNGLKNLNQIEGTQGGTEGC